MIRIREGPSNAGRLLGLVLLCGALVAPADADTLVLLDGVTVTACDDPWMEGDVALQFVLTTAEDCVEDRCDFGTDVDRVWLYPARLSLDLGSLSGLVTGAEVDVVDYCGAGCTNAFLYDGVTTVDAVPNTVVSSPETLVLTAGGATVDRIAVSSCEGAVVEIRISTEVVPFEDTTWGEIKTLYR